MRLLSMAELRTVKGICLCRAQIFRLIKEGRFPRPVKISTNRNGFVESEIDNYIQAKIAERDAASGEVA